MLAGGEPSDLLFSDPCLRLVLHQYLCLTIHGRIPVCGPFSSQSEKYSFRVLLQRNSYNPTGNCSQNLPFLEYSFRLIRNCLTTLRLLLCRKVKMPSSVPHKLAEPIIAHKTTAGIYPRWHYLRIQYVLSYHSL